MTTFEEQRGQLFGIAYRMLGSAMDAEDIVQEAWLRYQQNTTTPENPAAYLRKIVTNLSLDHLKSARVQREHYVGDWLPEPIRTDDGNPATALATSEAISMAFLVVLERLSPLERAVFILRRVFDYDYSDIAHLLDRSESACRQLFSRATRHIEANRPRYDAPPQVHQQLVTQFMRAIRDGNIDALADLLAEEAVLISDGGGNAPAATHPLHGREVLRQFFAGLFKQAQRQKIAFTIEQVTLNGEAGLVLRDPDDHQALLAVTFEVQTQHIVTLHWIRNPDKLTRL